MKLTEEQINTIARQISWKVGWRVSWYLFRYPLIFLAGMLAGVLLMSCSTPPRYDQPAPIYYNPPTAWPSRP